MKEIPFDFTYPYAVEAAFKEFMQTDTNGAGSHTVISTWCSDLVIALQFEDKEPGAIRRIVEDCKEFFTHEYDYIMEMTAALNYLCWHCYKQDYNPKFTKLFSDLYYEMMDFAYKNLTNDEYCKMVWFLD